VSVVCCQVEVSDELITRPEESYRLWCVVVCDLENLNNEEAVTRVGSQRHKKKKLHLVGYFHSCITMHGFMNVKSEYTLLLGAGQITSTTRNWRFNP